MTSLDTARSELIQAMEAFKLNDVSAKTWAPRPGFGVAGHPITVRANMFLTKFVGPKGKGLTVNFYDVEINPVVKVANQKKPKQLLRAVWNQLCREQAAGPAKKAFDASAFDGNKIAFSPLEFPLSNGVAEFTVGLQEDGQDPQSDSRRFKIVLQFSTKVDLDVLSDFCSKKKQSQEQMESVYAAMQACNILFREDPTSRFTPVGAQGRRFFGAEGSVPMSSGGQVCQGFMQSFRWTQTGFPAMQIDTAYSAFIQPGPLLEVAGRLLGLADQEGGGGHGGRGGGRGDGRGGGRGDGRGGGRGDGRGGGRGDGRGGGRGDGRGGARGGRGGNPPPTGGQGGASIRELNKFQIKKLVGILRMAKFTVTHRRTDRIFTLLGITQQPASELKFLLNGRDGAADRMVSIPQYFRETYNVMVTKPDLPCVQYGKKNFVPIEFVRISDFNSIPMTRLTADQTADMIKVAAKPPPERAEKITSWRQKLNYENLPKVKSWGLQVDKEMMRVKARILSTPNVHYGGGKSMRPFNGGWNLKGVKFAKPGRPLDSWSVISFDRRCDQPQMKNFLNFLIKTLNLNGCPVKNVTPPCIEWGQYLTNGSLAGVKAGLLQAARAAYLHAQATPQLIMVILPGKDSAMYMEIKKQAMWGLKAAVPTQCLQSAKIRGERGLEQYCGNVSMKIHSKLGGITHHVPAPSVLDKTTMMIGADVTHPPPRQGTIQPSIAVSVSGINGDNVQFSTNVRLQEGRTEIIKDFSEMIRDHITIFQRNTKAKPDKIIVFRDGVSEGQWSQVVDHEVKAIMDAADEFGGGYTPKITFVVCAKRHNMRFFADKGDQDRTGNLPPGTVVDQAVTHPFAFDFYLQAHSGLQGTARPTHYVVVRDENKFNADDMQALCNSLSYSYARATRSVSMVPVAYYADIIATQARSFVYSDDPDDDDTATISSGGGIAQRLAEFNPSQVSNRLQASPEFNSVAWYM